MSIKCLLMPAMKMGRPRAGLLHTMNIVSSFSEQNYVCGKKYSKKKKSSNVFLPWSPSPPFADVNDNVPFFVSSNYEVSVPEGADVGTSVVQVLATDLDSGLHGEV